MKLNKIIKYYEKYVNPITAKTLSYYSHSKDVFLKGKGVYIFTDKKK